jgi:hypothetical protein
MSQIVAAYGAGWIALGADRGMWQDLDDGGLLVGQHAHSKLHVVPGYPMVIATTGPVYTWDVVREFIGGNAFSVAAGAIKRGPELWSRLHAAHTTRLGKDRVRMTMLVAAVDDLGIPRIVRGKYPIEEADWTAAFCMYGEEIDGYASGIYADGIHNVKWDAPFGSMRADKGIEVVRKMLETIDHLEVMRENAGERILVRRPYDIALITNAGVEWVEVAKACAASA